jgi:hypothetical protein
MADTINVAGKPVNKWVVFGGGGLVLVGGVYYYRKQQADKANASAISSAADQGDGTSADIDPATGYAYGSAEDTAALASQTNSSDLIGSADYNAGGEGLSGGIGTVGGFATNAEWAQYVEQYLVDNEGSDAPTVGNAIGKYLTGVPLTDPDWVSIVESAIAIGGYPPVSGPNGNPPSYTTSSTTPTTPVTTPTTPTTPGQTMAGAISNLQATVSGTTANIRWNSAPAPSQGYEYVMSELNGTVTKKGNLGKSATSISIGGLHKGWTYNFGIQGLPGGDGNNIHIAIP